MIALEADLHVESAGMRVRIEGSGHVLTCRLTGDIGNLFATLRRSGQLLHAVRAAIPLLVRFGIRVDVVVGSLQVGQAGRGVKQNAAACLLRLPAARIGT